MHSRMKCGVMRSYPSALILALVSFAVLGIYSPAVLAQDSNKPPPLTSAIIDQWGEEISNWGRWGEDDELGTLNLITPEKRKNAAGLVKDGVSVSLALDINKSASFEQSMKLLDNWAVDTYSINYHGLAHSHIDALCHIFWNGKIYNGYSKESVKLTGTEKLGIQNMKNGIFTRGVLMDIPRLKGVPYLEPGTPIMAEDLEAWERKAGIKVQSGDVLLIRTGWRVRAKEHGTGNSSGKAAGLHASVAKWLKARDIAVLGSDRGSDMLPSGVEGVIEPIHLLVLAALGTPILDNLDLEAVAEEAAKRERWEFLFVAAPIRVLGGTGSPLNPIATF